ncbi:NADAR family protein [Streptomyces sp. SS7]|uniref:NADAR family protein n=1 Tax=Streptomyces sp. SS7 TaxID=3108485 RepID=UPI0030EDC59D
MTICFYGADEVPYGCFSNFSAHGFELDGVWWPTPEHFFQAQKFRGTRHVDLIRRARTPLRAAELGRHASRPLRRDGERVKDDVMRRVVLTKFYAPDWVLVGDDSGGRGLFMRRHDRDRAAVYGLDLGAVEHDIEAVGELLTDDLLGWLAEGAGGGCDTTG